MSITQIKAFVDTIPSNKKDFAVLHFMCEFRRLSNQNADISLLRETVEYIKKALAH